MSTEADPTPPTQPRPSRRPPVAGPLLLVAGLLTILATALVEEAGRGEGPWARTLFDPDGEALWEGTMPLSARRVPIENFPGQTSFFEGAERGLEDQPEQLAALGLNLTEWMLAIDGQGTDLEVLLESGRVPVAGEPEVLAGILTRADQFEIGGEDFHVVGRIRRDAPGLFFSYVMPAHDRWAFLFDSANGGTSGWIDPEGADRLIEMDGAEGLARRHRLQGTLSPSGRPITWAVLTGLVLVAVGGALLHRAVFAVLALRPPALLGPALRGVVDSRRLFLWMHVILYGGFFGMAVLAVANPFWNMVMQNYIVRAFAEGELSYVGDAYGSGSVPRAAWATWFNNFLVQTGLMTVLVSFVVPCIGVLKTLVSFMMVGFGMAPLWAGMAGTFVFHSITMTLELEAYIVACMGVCLFWYDVLRRDSGESVTAGVRRGFRIVVSTTLLSGLMLAGAALYEAVTLILLR